MGSKGLALKISRFINNRIVPGKGELPKNMLYLWHKERNTDVINKLVLPFDYAASVMSTIISKLFLVYILFSSCWIIQILQNIFSLKWVSTVRVKLPFSFSPINLHSAM